MLDRYKGGQNWKRIFEKTRVGFGRTEVSLPVCLQSGLASIIRAWSQGTGVGFDRGGILYFWGALLRESKVKNWKSILAKTRVGFGHTEVSLQFVCTVLCILSYGRGPKGQALERV